MILIISAEEEEGVPSWGAGDPAVPLHDVARPRRPLAHPPRPQVHQEVGRLQPGRRGAGHRALQAREQFMRLSCRQVL